MLQADDVDVHERGVDLAFRRTFNSMSGHDVYNTDGSAPSIFGNQWTNTFDTHMAYNQAANVMTVYDVDGARYDYTASNGSWIPPAGQFAQLTWDGACGYYWTKPSGEVYHFYSPGVYTGNTCGTFAAGLYGRIYTIIGRNNNATIQFSYSLSGNGSSIEQTTQIVATQSDGHSLTLNFGVYGSYTELSSIVRPDGSQVTYSYDTNGNLLEVDRPGNNTASVLPETYAYSSSGSTRQFTIYSPRATLAARAGTQDGSYYTVSLSSDQTMGTYETGLFNPTPADGTNTAIQSGPAWTVIDSRAFSGYGSGTTSFTDSFGHATTYTVDGQYRLISAQAWTGSQWLGTSQSWDTSNDLISVVDARGNETDVAYDGSGNPIAEAGPAVATSAGTIRPTKLFTYDAYHNVLSYCDPIAANALGLNWTTRPTQAQCPLSSQATQLTYAYPAYEPYGELVTKTGPATAAATSGYVTTITYSPSAQGGTDYGLPTNVTSPSFVQMDGSTRSPSNSYTYDAFGNLSTSNNGVGVSRYTYDSLNRIIRSASPDDSSNGGAYSDWTAKTYYPDDSVATVQDPAQANAGVSATYTYDADGDPITEVHHYGCTTASPCTTGPKTSVYDGGDRLVEVIQPYSSADFYSYAWMTRYIYDISQNTNQSFRSTSFLAHGNSFKKQMYVGTDSASDVNQWAATGWTDISGNAFDALDRPVAHYGLTVASTSQLAATTQVSSTYDGNGYLGLLSSSTDANGNVTTPSYNALGQITGATYTGTATPSLGYTYDPDGRIAAESSGALTDSFSYDNAGNVVSHTEPSGSGVTDATIQSYTYYPDNTKAALTLSPQAGQSLPGFSGPFKEYSYRNDGVLQTANFIFNGTTYPFSWTHTVGGRTLTRNDLYNSPAYTYTYDAYGRTASYNAPNIGFTNLGYDLENDPTQMNAYSTTVANTYSVRGELIGEAYGTDQCQAVTGTFPLGGQTPVAWEKSASANGYLVPVPVCAGGYAERGLFDHNTGASLYSGGISSTGSATGTAYTYDTAGHVSGTDNYNRPTINGTQYTCDVNATRVTDAQDHLSSISVVSPNLEVRPPCSKTGTALYTYLWGATGHQVVLTEAGTLSHTLHWDGGQLLFESTSDGTVATVDLDSMGMVLSSGLLISDFDLSGNTVDQRTSTTPHSPLSFAPGVFVLSPAAQAGASTQYDTPTVVIATRDMLSDGLINIQGARTYEQGARTFGAPDAAGGNPSDPMSQLAYPWNRNNPYVFEDPTGNAATCSGTTAPNTGGAQACNATADDGGNGLKIIGRTSTTTTNPTIYIGPSDDSSGMASSVPRQVAGNLNTGANVFCIATRSCGLAPVVFSSDPNTGRDHGYRQHKKWRKPRASQASVRSGILDSLTVATSFGYFKPGGKLESWATADGENIIYRASWLNGTIYVTTYGAP